MVLIHRYFPSQNGASSSNGDAPRGAGPQVLPGEVHLLPAAILHYLRHITRSKSHYF